MGKTYKQNDADYEKKVRKQKFIKKKRNDKIVVYEKIRFEEESDGDQEYKSSRNN